MHCEGNGLFLRTLATGTELHALKGHKSKVGKVQYYVFDEFSIINLINKVREA